MFSKKIFYILGSSLILAGCLAGTLNDPRPSNPSALLPTLEQLTIDGKKILLAQLDPTKLQLRVVENRSRDTAKNIETIHQDTKSTLSFNGSFFSPEYQPLGLLVSEGKLLSPLHKSELMNGIFTVNQKGQAQIFTFADFQKRQSQLLPTIDFAIQSGPILLDQKGQIQVDKKNTITAGRTSIGLDKDNNIVILMMRQTLLDRSNALTLYDFAELVDTHAALSDLGLHSLINLDGGNSSGMAIADQYFPELEKVQHVIITVKKDS